MENFIIVDSKHIEVPFECMNWGNASDKVKRHTKVNPRTRACRLIVIHTVHGRKCTAVAPGGKASTRDLSWAKSHWNSAEQVSVDAYIDTDGSCVWANDPALFYTWGAGSVNPVSLNIEIVTDEDGLMYEASLDTLALLVPTLCATLGIQMQTPWDHEKNEPYAGRIELLDPEEGGRRAVGVVGHRNIWGYPSKIDPETGKKSPDKSKPLTSVRGFGDPNSWPFLRLVNQCKFEKLEFHARDQKEPEVIRVWRERQNLFFPSDSSEIDGIPLAKTVAKLKEQNHRDGMWILWDPTPRRSVTKPGLFG